MFSVLSVCVGLSVHDRLFDRPVAEQYHRSDSNQGTDYSTNYFRFSVTKIESLKVCRCVHRLTLASTVIQTQTHRTHSLRQC